MGRGEREGEVRCHGIAPVYAGCVLDVSALALTMLHGTSVFPSVPGRCAVVLGHLAQQLKGNGKDTSCNAVLAKHQFFLPSPSVYLRLCTCVCVRQSDDCLSFCLCAVSTGPDLQGRATVGGQQLLFPGHSEGYAEHSWSELYLLVTVHDL